MTREDYEQSLLQLSGYEDVKVNKAEWEEIDDFREFDRAEWINGNIAIFKRVKKAEVTMPEIERHDVIEKLNSDMCFVIDKADRSGVLAINCMGQIVTVPLNAVKDIWRDGECLWTREE